MKSRGKREKGETQPCAGEGTLHPQPVQEEGLTFAYRIRGKGLKTAGDGRRMQRSGRREEGKKPVNRFQANLEKKGEGRDAQLH